MFTNVVLGLLFQSFLNFLLKDDTLKAQMQSFLLSTASQNEITAYDNKVS